MAKNRITYRVRIPVATTRATRRRRTYRTYDARRSKKMRGGILPFLAPILAAAVGAIPGIASVALAAKRNN